MIDLRLNGLHALIVETLPTHLLTQSTSRLLAWPDEAATLAFAKHFAALPAVRDAFIELHGDLGAGKTTFVRHLLRALGVQGRVKSPSYAVVEPYTVAIPELLHSVRAEPVEATENPSTLRQARDRLGSGRTDTKELNIWHFDLYRFADPREFEEAGFRDLLASPGLKLIEWPEKARGALPVPDLALHITALANDSRSVQAVAHTLRGRELLA